MDDAYVRALMTDDGADVLDAISALVWTRPDWHHDAACRGVGAGVFFIERGADLAPARRLCHTCPVRRECGEASRDEPHGFWAGLSARQRTRTTAA